MATENLITPHLIYRKGFPAHKFIFDIAVTIAIAIARLVLSIIGLVVVAVAIPFSVKTGTINAFGWQMERLPSWAWPWSNDYDGIQGQKNGKNYTDHPMDSFRGKYHWTAIRNSLNNFLRYVVGFDYRAVTYIEHWGSEQDIRDGVRGWCYYRAHVIGRPFAMHGIALNYGWVIWIGWKITSSRHADRPWCGWTVHPWRDKTSVTTQ